MPRILTSELISTFEYLCKSIDKPAYDDALPFADNRDRGAWQMQYSSCNGGWRIVELLPQGGYLSSVFCPLRLSPSKFADAMWHWITCVQMFKETK